MTFLLSLALLAAEPLTPAALRDALNPPAMAPDAAKALAARARESFFKDKDPAKGIHVIDGETVAFVIEAPEGTKPRVGGDFVQLNRGRGYDMKEIPGTGLWAVVATVPGDTKFSYRFQVGGKKVGGATVEMPGWKAPPEASEVAGRKYGEYKPLAFRSEVFHNKRTGWVYVPAAYDGKIPAALMVFQDGDAYKGEHVGTVVENLIADGSMPLTIVVGLNPGVNDDGRSNRSVEYDSMDDRYARFLAEEVLPRVGKDYRLRPDANSHAIGGASSGGICAFTAAWHRPDLFGRVCSQIGSFTNIRGGNAYPDLVRKTPKKPIVRVHLHDGENDLINRYGDWWEANRAMVAALKEAGYDVDFLADRCFHGYTSCGRVLPTSLRATWAGYPR